MNIYLPFYLFIVVLLAVLIIENQFGVGQAEVSKG